MDVKGVVDDDGDDYEDEKDDDHDKDRENEIKSDGLDRNNDDKHDNKDGEYELVDTVKLVVADNNENADATKAEIDAVENLKEIRRNLNARYEERVYGGVSKQRGEYDSMWKEIDKLIVEIKDNEEEWTKGSREENEQVKKKEK